MFLCSYLDHVRKETADEGAGGYTNEYPCQRAIQEAFDMLLFVKELSPSHVQKKPVLKTETMEL